MGKSKRIKLLKFSDSTKQAKLQGLLAELRRQGYPVSKVFSISLPSGWSCPGATDCLSKADRVTGKITDGPNTKYRCFAATQEAFQPSLRAQRWHNFDLLRAARTRPEIFELIMESIPVNAAGEVVRIHVGGDMYSQAYMGAWIDVARARPDIIWYAYTKSIHHWAKLGELPDNLVFTASEGGRFDHLIGDRKRAVVVFHPDEAAQLGLDIDHDDTHAAVGRESFALLLHGTQPKDSKAAAAKKILAAENIQHSYSAA
jgi:hypothetical protein